MGQEGSQGSMNEASWPHSLPQVVVRHYHDWASSSLHSASFFNFLSLVLSHPFILPPRGRFELPLQITSCNCLALSFLSFMSTMGAVLIRAHHMTLSASSLFTSLHCLECIVMVYITTVHNISTAGAYHATFKKGLFHYTRIL